MRFINKGEPIKIRIGEPGECYWATIKRNEVVELSERYGLALGFEEVKTTEGKLGDLVVQTKQVSIPQKHNQNDFFKELCSINGIGKKTAEDIVGVFKTKKILLEAVESALRFPFRDDIEIKLREFYGA